MSDNYLHKILNNTASEAEKKEFYDTLKNDSEKRDEFYQSKNLFVLSQINSESYQKQQNESFVNFWDKVHSAQSSKIISIWMRYAAIFILASVLGFLAESMLNRKESITLSQHIEYSSEKGSVSTIHLEDGSVIWLSSGTNLILNKNSQGETTATLNGEAYFELIPNPERNFVIDFGQFKVKDIGTKFNIRAYESESSISTSLVEGKIDLINEYGKSILKMNPGEFINYGRLNNKITVSQRDPSVVKAWTEGKFVFIDQTLTEICNELENWYNIEIQIEDQKLANTRYTSVVKRSTTVKMVLQILAITDHINYEIIDKKEGKDLIKIRK